MYDAGRGLSGMKSWPEKLGNVRLMVLGMVLMLLAALWLVKKIFG
ncbi:MAG: hypothetical protein WBG23_01215 [Acidobacteriaceae bacterium]|jgi:hypothetical protein